MGFKKIKKLSALASAAVLWTAAAYAAPDAGTSEAYESRRETGSEHFLRRVIVEGSLLSAGYQGGDSSRYSKPNGYSAGLMLDLLGNGNLVLEAGALYRELGVDIDSGLGNNKFTANYISVPVSAKYYFAGQEATSVYVKGGLMGSTLLSNNRAYTSPTRQIGARSWETSLLAGVGYKVQLSSMTDILIEANYTRSIDTIFPDTNIYRSDLVGTLGLALNL